MDNRDAQHEPLAFFGKIVASLSHEIMNVIAIEKELSGLLEDLVLLAEKKAAPVDPARLKSIGEKMFLQAERGETLIRRLNRFSHSVDEPRRSEDLRDLVFEAIQLCGRFAALRQVNLEADLSEQGFRVELDPFAFYRTIFTAIHAVLYATPADGTVRVRFQGEADRCRIAVESADGGVVPDEATRSPAALAGTLGGELQRTDNGLVLIFTKGAFGNAAKGSAP